MAFVQFDLSSLINAKKRRIKPPFTLYTIIATWFYIGMIGVMPGTLGSLAVLPIYGVIANSACKTFVCAQKYFTYAAIFTFLVGWWAIDRFQKKTNTYDHSFIVIDEVVGMLVAFALCFEYAHRLAKPLMPLFGVSQNWIAFFLVFAIFRFFDINKIFPINIVDRNFHNAFSVIFDDVLAAVYTAGTIFVLHKIIFWVI